MSDSHYKRYNLGYNSETGTSNVPRCEICGGRMVWKEVLYNPPKNGNVSIALYSTTQLACPFAHNNEYSPRN